MKLKVKETFKWLFETLWPAILIAIIVTILFRIYYVKKNNKKVVLYEEIIKLSFIIYILCLFYVVTYPDDYVSWSTSNYIPFREIFRYDLMSRLFIKNVLGNLFMFIPFGFYLSYLLKIRKVGWAFLFTTIVSLSIEITQSMIGRVFDIDDIILNVCGGLIGFYIYSFLHFLKNKFPKFFSNLMILTIMGIVLFITIALVIMFF
jgi:glycopeptide antibiotics resistance protein